MVQLPLVALPYHYFPSPSRYSIPMTGGALSTCFGTKSASLTTVSKTFSYTANGPKPDGSIIPYKPEPTKWHLPGHFLDREDKGAWPLSGVLFSPFTARQYDLPDPYLTFEYQNCWWSTKDPSPQCGYCTVGDWTEGWDVKHCSKSKNPFDKRVSFPGCH